MELAFGQLFFISQCPVARVPASDLYLPAAGGFSIHRRHVAHPPGAGAPPMKCNLLFDRGDKKSGPGCCCNRDRFKIFNYLIKRF